MTAITIRDVPDDVLRAIKVHAARAGQSLQAYALALLARDAAHPETVRPVEESRGRQAVLRSRGAATNPHFAGVTTDELMGLLRG
jgi:plasmid stability protein